MAAATEGVDKDLEIEEERGLKSPSGPNAIGAKTGNKRAYTLSRHSQTGGMAPSPSSCAGRTALTLLCVFLASSTCSVR